MRNEEDRECLIFQIMSYMDFNRIGKDGEHFDGSVMSICIELLEIEKHKNKRLKELEEKC